MLESWMDFYVIIFSFAGLGVALLTHLSVLRGDKKSEKYTASQLSLPPDKRNAFSWMAFFSLNLTGLLVPIFAFVFKTTPNNPLVEVPFCLFYSLGPFLISQWLLVNKETGRLAVSPPTFWWVYLIGCWIWPWRVLKSGFDGRILIIAAPIICAALFGVSIILIISVLPSLIIFSIVFDITRVHDQQTSN